MVDNVRSLLPYRVPLDVEAPRPLLRGVDEPEPFPVAALGSLTLAAQAIEAHTRAPIAICAQAVLGAVALVGQAHCDVTLPSGQQRPLSLMLLTIAGSGERKSAVDGLALRAVYEREKQLHARFASEIQSHATTLAIWEGQRAAIIASRKGMQKKSVEDSFDVDADLAALGPAPEAPLAPILVCPDPTFEGYVKLTAIGQPSMGLFSAEGGGFIGGHGMSKDNRLKTAAGISSVWDGEPIKRVRAGDGAIVLVGRRLSVHLMAQPEVAAQMLSDDLLVSQGLLSRFLIVAPASTAGTRFFAEPSGPAVEALDGYHRRLAEMLTTAAPLRDGSQNELEPRPLSMCVDAAAIWIAFHDHCERQLGPGGELSEISGLGNKAAEHAARLAGLLTLWDDLQAEKIDEEAMGHATILVQHYLNEALRLRAAAVTDVHLQLCARVLQWIQNCWHEPAIYPALIYNDCPIRAVRDRAAALRVIATLAEHGCLHRLEERVRINGATRNEAWLVHGRSIEGR